MKYTVALAAVATLALAGQAEARDQIRIVGSSTVFPFSTAVAEQFGKAGAFKTPVVESTGTGGGFKLFCAGVGVDDPDITNASRPIKESEIADCAKNGVTAITEVKIGYDGIVLANSKGHAPLALTVKDVWLALAKDVPVDGKLGAMGGAAPGAAGRNMDHLCLRVEPFGREAIVAHLQAHGVRIGDFGSRYGAEGEGPSQYLYDPEGNLVELKGPPDAA